MRAGRCRAQQQEEDCSDDQKAFHSEACNASMVHIRASAVAFEDGNESLGMGFLYERFLERAHPSLVVSRP